MSSARRSATTCRVHNPVIRREQHARWLLWQLLGFHVRENKSIWWEYFRCLELTDEVLIEDRATLGGLEYVGETGKVKNSIIHRYRRSIRSVPVISIKIRPRRTRPASCGTSTTPPERSI